jgi:very-short-patch-repair endonuclease
MNKTEVFIEKARLKHGDTYDYSKVEYKTCKDKVTIICKEHGKFLQTPDSHINGGSGCSKCGDVNCSNKLKSNTNTFITKAIAKHGTIYDYSQVNYKYSSENIIIICKQHGEFLQQPSNHLQGKGCNKCGEESISTKNKSNTETWLKDALQIHGDTYDYSQVEYKYALEKVIIICKIHGEFLQTPSSHISKKSGCGKCIGRNRTTVEFINQSKIIHGNTYDYCNVNYTTSHNKVNINCKIHGMFLQTPSKHLDGQGCSKCGDERASNTSRGSTDEFINNSVAIHGDRYDYSMVNYISYHTKCKIICKIHGEFLQTPNSHLHGTGCTFCINKTEGKLYEKIRVIYPTLATQYRQEWCKKSKYLPYDFCIPDLNIIIELDGAQHFKQVMNWSSPEQQFENDKYKEQCANDNNYSVIRLLQEDVWNDKYDWCKELCDAIEDIKRGDDIVNIYLCKNNEYDQF